MEIVQAIYSRPTPDQALLAVVKDYIRHVEPKTEAKVERIVVEARDRVAQELREERG